MTRLWGLPPVWLCREHLLGEHKEMHQEAGTLLNHPHGEAIVNGHAEKGQVKLSEVKPRHEELARELLRRGYNHESPFNYDLSDFEDRGEINLKENRRDLRNRCDDCAARMRAFQM